MVAAATHPSWPGANCYASGRLTESSRLRPLAASGCADPTKRATSSSSFAGSGRTDSTAAIPSAAMRTTSILTSPMAGRKQRGGLHGAPPLERSSSRWRRNGSPKGLCGSYLMVALAVAGAEVRVPSDAVTLTVTTSPLSPLPLTFRSKPSVGDAVVAVRLTTPFTLHAYV